MTAPGRFLAATHPPGGLGVRSVSHVTFTVRDLKAAPDVQAAFALDVRTRHGGSAFTPRNLRTAALAAGRERADQEAPLPPARPSDHAR